MSAIRLKQLSNAVKLIKTRQELKRWICSTPLLHRNFRSPIKFSKPKKLTALDIDVESLEKEDFKEDDLVQLLDRSLLSHLSGHQVLVVQPYIKWGLQKKMNTTPELQLLESVTLIKTLRKWKVVGEFTIGLESFNKKTFFGKGNLFRLKELIENEKTVSAVFVSVDTLSLIQQITLQEFFGVPVFDRYTIIIHIFREHAESREAKLQVQLAELPYLWTILRGMQLGVGEKFGGGACQMGGFGPKLLETRREIFRMREAKLKRAIQEIREQREKKRKAREETEIPTVAIVGYTNAGKTSIIKVLTGKQKLEPQDYLFATLDVTSHLGILPSNMNVYYIDTLGFISDIPTYLIESFVYTLEDATNADLIIHVRDVSHPDTVAQNDNVMKTLTELNLSETVMNNIITVGNKIDLVPGEKLQDLKTDDMIMVSCTKLTGIDILRQEIEKRILRIKKMLTMVIRVKTGGEEYDWLQEEATVVNESPDPNDNQYTLLNVIMTNTILAKFKYKFIENYVKR